MVWGEHHNGFLGQVQVIQGLQDLADLGVHIRHGCVIVLSNAQLQIKHNSKKSDKITVDSVQDYDYTKNNNTPTCPLKCLLMQLSKQLIMCVI